MVFFILMWGLAHLVRLKSVGTKPLFPRWNERWLASGGKRKRRFHGCQVLAGRGQSPVRPKGRGRSTQNVHPGRLSPQCRLTACTARWISPPTPPAGICRQRMGSPRACCRGGLGLLPGYSVPVTFQLRSTYVLSTFLRRLPSRMQISRLDCLRLGLRQPQLRHGRPPPPLVEWTGWTFTAWLKTAQRI